ncbi:MAG: superoxide dismutase [Bacteroidota bacterium]
MEKRTFLKLASVGTAGLLISPLSACSSGDKNAGEATTIEEAASAEFTLPKLPYAFDALAPHIDAQTMEIHHDKHHAGYVRKLNKAVSGTPREGKNLKELLSGLTDASADTAVRNSGGGHYNHTLFWEVMAPNAGGEPTGALADAINGSFDDYEKFKSVFFDAAKSVFGSGWAWLCVGEDKKLFVSSTPNQDNPIMKNLVEKSGTPILGIDVWEHAYYLKYQNMRGDYINAFFNLINWENVAVRFSKVS